MAYVGFFIYHYFNLGIILSINIIYDILFLTSSDIYITPMIPISINYTIGYGI